jgi:ABC-2 type transport system ATP-binding protein
MLKAIEVSRLRVQFGKVDIIRDLSITIPEGRIVALLGPSGTGKTTLVKAIMGMNPISSGSIRVFDTAVPSFAAVSQIGYMAQTDALYADISALDNLLFFGNLSGIRGKAARERASELLEFTELSADRDKQVRKFSSGMKRRLSLAIALMNNPRLLILDEPTVGIDPMLRRRFRDQFIRLKEQGCTIFMTTHVMDEALSCDEVILMRGGNIIAHGSPDGLIRNANAADLEAAFLHYISVAEKEAQL